MLPPLPHPASASQHLARLKNPTPYFPSPQEEKTTHSSPLSLPQEPQMTGCKDSLGSCHFLPGCLGLNLGLLHTRPTLSLSFCPPPPGPQGSPFCNWPASLSTVSPSRVAQHSSSPVSSTCPVIFRTLLYRTLGLLGLWRLFQQRCPSTPVHHGPLSN